MEIHRLTIGSADFTCCQRNHIITTETQKVMSGNTKTISCDKPIVGSILEQLIDAKVNHLFNAEGDLVMARFHYVLKHWWMRGLKENRKIVKDQYKSALEKFKEKLRWGHDEEWFDQNGLGLLQYAVSSDEVSVVQELLQDLKRDFKGKEYTRRLESRIRDEGFVAFGVTGGGTALSAAMMTASPEIVGLLLHYGANVKTVDVLGNDPFMFASSVGNVENIQFWLNYFKKWNLSRINTVFGGCPLGQSVYIGSNKFKTVKVLLNAGARLDFRTFSGGTALTGAVENEDSDPEIVRLLLNQSEIVKSQINYQRRPTTLKWKSIYFVAKRLWRMGISKSGLMGSLAIDAGTTPLNLAVVRGDVEIVKMLLEAGADPYVENDLGMNAFEICERCGPFPRVMSVLNGYVRKE